MSEIITKVTKGAEGYCSVIVDGVEIMYFKEVCEIKYDIISALCLKLEELQFTVNNLELENIQLEEEIYEYEMGGLGNAN